MKKYIFILILHVFIGNVSAQTPIEGTIISSVDKNPIPGASIQIKGTNRVAISNNNGNFFLNVRSGDTINVSFIGFQPQQIIHPLKTHLLIELVPAENALQEVVVSTGYQVLPKERATGSFVQIDNKLIDRSVSTNIIDRLRDVVPGLSFNKTGNSQLSIRGQSTIFGNADPLIVIDNFPFDGNLQDINPNDVESITVLKDAAAASIWGARAGNGVIVITSKKGKLNSPVKISFNSNVTIGAIPDLYARNTILSSDYINIEKRLFSEGYYNTTITTGYQPLTPVVELLLQKRNNPSLGTQIDAEIEALKQNDIRKDLDKYIYQKSVYQQYSLNLRGGGKNNSFFVSGGLDRNKENLQHNDYNRASISAGNIINLFNNKLEINNSLNFIYNNTKNNNGGPSDIINGTTAGSYIYPYAQLSDEHGNALPLVKNFNTSFISSASQSGLLDWNYAPLDEINIADNTTKRRNIRLSTALKYNILQGLSASILYQYTDISATGRNFRSQDSYFTRDLINRYTQITGSNIIRPIPLGGILDMNEQSSINHSLRGQIDYSKAFNTIHEINAIGGYEIRDTRTDSRTYRYYGYDIEHANNSVVNYVTNTFPFYYDSSRKAQIPNIDNTGIFNDRFRSYYANASYSYDRRYTISASGRIDQSNLFGVKTNQKGVPLWSAGVGWNINNESFYSSELIPLLKIRATYGYNGSVNKSVSAYTTASISGVNLYQLPYATIINPPNPELRWERIKIFNMGVDFSSKGNRISGSLEYYNKKGVDLIGDTPFPPSSGISLFRGNVASTVTNGIDLNLSTKNTIGFIKWSTDFFYSHLNEKVKGYALTSSANNYIRSGSFLPLSGRPLFSLYSYSWAGLNPETGDPQGFLNGEISNDYLAILNGTTTESMIFSGSLRPTTFGALRNTFSIKDFSLSFNIGFKFGHYFRRSSVGYGNTYGLNSNSNDYALRWKNPGDETTTNIPSIPLGSNGNRDALYTFSTILVEKADNIRFQDLRLDYNLLKSKKNRYPFNSALIYLYATNLGIIWKATDRVKDPENQFGNTPFTLAVGLKVDF
ncbi:TonB-dependent receptor [Pedobacter cryoconitis]|uniref:TonB-dependent receptor n=1 Tax=Pedobacter cryoconitis TaxID=188932 RepID=A0A127VFW3_9SPHI|nr:SusC/RagA family TonB-linked outer membrane protein [Pedobacter cryoconitis]AMP99818.1 TonB-dependent receptor [Pedobacter cryoconitis]